MAVYSFNHSSQWRRTSQAQRREQSLGQGVYSIPSILITIRTAVCSEINYGAKKQKDLSRNGKASCTSRESYRRGSISLKDWKDNLRKHLYGIGYYLDRAFSSTMSRSSLWLIVNLNHSLFWRGRKIHDPVRSDLVEKIREAKPKINPWTNSSPVCTKAEEVSHENHFREFGTNHIYASLTSSPLPPPLWGSLRTVFQGSARK